MKRSAVLVSTAAGLVVAASVAAGAGAPPPARSMAVRPLVVPYGGSFTASGTGCVDDPPTDVPKSVAIYGRGLADDTPIDPQGDLLGVADVAADGTWTFSWTIPEAAPVRQQEGSFIRAIRATCGTLNPPLLATTFDYDPVEVRFEAAPVPVTLPPETVPAAPTTVPAAASPAAAVPAAPGYTG